MRMTTDEIAKVQHQMFQATYSVPQAAAICGYTRHALYHHIRQGTLKATKVNGGTVQIARKDLLEFLGITEGDLINW